MALSRCVDLFWHISQTSPDETVETHCNTLQHLLQHTATHISQTSEPTTAPRVNQWRSSPAIAWWHDSFMCVTWLKNTCDMSHSYVCFFPYHCLLTWRTHMCDTAHSYVWHGSLICATWLIHVCDMTNSYVRHGSLIYATWLTHTWDIIRS